jgi:hypothetical protein
MAEMRRFLAVFLLLLVGGAVLGAPAQAGPPDRTSGADIVRTRVTVPAASLTAAWWQKFAAITDSDQFEGCDTGTGHVIFLTGATTAGPVNRSCEEVPAGRSLLVPLINVECSEVEGNGSTYSELKACANGFAVDFTDMFLTIDGVAVPDPSRFRVQSGLFYFTSVKDNVMGIPKSAGPTPSVSDGYWAQIGPLSVGRHTVIFGGTYFEFNLNVTYNLTVVPSSAR